MDSFAIQSTCMEVSVNLSYLFVHEPQYQTTVVPFLPQFFAHGLVTDFVLIGSHLLFFV